MNSLYYQKRLSRNIGDKFFTSLSVICALIAILPLIFLVTYILIKGGSQITPELFTLEPNPPGDDLNAGGINPALIGTLIIAGVPSIIAGVFIYALVVSTKILFGSMYSGLAGGMALSILMLPTVIKTTDEGLKLVPNELRYASLGVGASMYTTILKVTLPSAFRSIATGVVLGIARAAGETAPLIFTALFSYYYITGFGDLFYEMGSLAVLIYNFALEPYDAQNKLAWAASFILVLSILSVNIFSRILAAFTEKTKRV